MRCLPCSLCLPAGARGCGGKSASVRGGSAPARVRVSTLCTAEQRLPLQSYVIIKPAPNSLDLQSAHCCDRCCNCQLMLCRSFRRAAAAGDGLAGDVVDQLLKVLSGGASLLPLVAAGLG